MQKLAQVYNVRVRASVGVDIYAAVHTDIAAPFFLHV